MQRLLAEDDSRRMAVRRYVQQWPDKVVQHVTGDLDPSTNWSVALEGISAAVHCAARVHVMTDAAANPLAEFRRVNVQGTLNLARQAVVAGVRRFVFISSIKVNGESTLFGSPFRADDAPAPLDAYGMSKMEAERGLREIAAQTQGRWSSSIRPWCMGSGSRRTLPP